MCLDRRHSGGRRCLGGVAPALGAGCDCCRCALPHRRRRHQPLQNAAGRMSSECQHPGSCSMGYRVWGSKGMGCHQLAAAFAAPLTAQTVRSAGVGTQVDNRARCGSWQAALGTYLEGAMASHINSCRQLEVDTDDVVAGMR